LRTATAGATEGDGVLDHSRLAYEVAKQRVGRPRADVGLRPSKTDAVVRRFAAVPIFEGCSKRELRAVAKAAVIEQRANGATLCSEGATGAELYLILQGTCRVSRRGRKVAELGPGGIVGELSVITGSERNATVSASSALEVAILRRRAFFGLLQDSPTFARKLLGTLAIRIQHLDAKQLG
jgi:CRP-like cAMP-binding protein